MTSTLLGCADLSALWIVATCRGPQCTEQLPRPRGVKPPRTKALTGQRTPKEYTLSVCLTVARVDYYDPWCHPSFTLLLAIMVVKACFELPEPLSSGWYSQFAFFHQPRRRTRVIRIFRWVKS